MMEHNTCNNLKDSDQTGAHCKLRLILQREEAGRLFLISPGFCFPLPADIDKIRIQIEIIRECTVPHPATGYESVNAVRSLDKMNKIRKYVTENFHRQITRDEVAGMLGMSLSGFSHFFKSFVGMNLNDYINAIRVEHAVRLLLTTGDTVSEIAYSCGFSTPSHFNRAFRHYKGMSPGELRR